MITIRDYGHTDGEDASPAIQAMLDDLGFVVLPVGEIWLGSAVEFPRGD